MADQKPVPESVEWWREAAQALGIKVFEEGQRADTAEKAFLNVLSDNTRLREAVESLLERVRPGSEAAPWVIAALQTALAASPTDPKTDHAAEEVTHG